MRLGCFGCSVLVLGILVLIVVIAGGVFLSLGLSGPPEVRPVPFSKNDGYSAQQKLFEITRRQAGDARRKEPIVISEREANAFLSRHLAESVRVPLSPLSVHFENGQILVQGQTALRNLLRGPALAQILSYVSTDRLDQPVWITVRSRISIEAGGGATRHATLSVTQFDLGRQALPIALLYSIMGGSDAGPFRWTVPSIVTGVDIEDGQAIIRTR